MSPIEAMSPIWIKHKISPKLNREFCTLRTHWEAMSTVYSKTEALNPHYTSEDEDTLRIHNIPDWSNVPYLN